LIQCIRMMAPARVFLTRPFPRMQPVKDNASPFRARQERLVTLLEKKNIGWLVITQPANIFYLTGFLGSAGVALFAATDEARLWVDPRYALQAGEQAQGVRVKEERKSPLKSVGQWLGRCQMGVACRVGFEDSHLTCTELTTLQVAAGRRVLFEPAGGLVEELRAVKDSKEIDVLRRAALLTGHVLDGLRAKVRPGVRESDLAAEIEYQMRLRGADGAAFATIVASGTRAALPHARASPREIKRNELVIIDLGAILAGYAADMTRTFYTGRPTRRIRSLYAAVLEAEQRAIESAEVGVKAGKVDGAARQELGLRGLGKYFTHSTGHGVGVEVHEAPRLARGQKEQLQAGHVVAVEPGIYLEGFGGVRLEDMVLVGNGGPEVLTPSTKADWFID
jgi:Xaa-Pro aminopeptidase